MKLSGVHAEYPREVLVLVNGNGVGATYASGSGSLTGFINMHQASGSIAATDAWLSETVA